MTLVNLTALETLLGTAGPIDAGTVTATYWAGTRPFVNVAGAAVTFPVPIRVDIVAGAVESPLNLTPTGGASCVRWDIRSAASGDPSLIRYTSIPGSGPVNFGDLPIVDPSTFVALDPAPASAQEILAEAIGAIGSAAAASASAAAAAASAASVIPSTDAAVNAAISAPGSASKATLTATFASVAALDAAVLGAYDPSRIVQAVDTAGAYIPGYRARIVFDAAGEPDDIVLVAN